MVLAELIADLLPAGVLNIVNGMGPDVGAPLAKNPRIAKIAFTGSTETGRLIMKAATENLIPVTLELGGKSPNIFFSDVMAQDDAFLDKAVEGFVLLPSTRRGLHLPSRALIQEDIYEEFIARCIERVKAIKQGDPRLPETMVGAQASQEQQDKIMSYLTIGVEEGAEVLVGGEAARFNGDIANGYYVQPTILKGHNKMRVFQEESLVPWCRLRPSRTRKKPSPSPMTRCMASAPVSGPAMRTVATDWPRHRGGRVWVNNYHAYPAHAAFGGYKQSGIGRENHKMMLDHYQQTKNILMSYNPNKLGFF